MSAIPNSIMVDPGVNVGNSGFGRLLMISGVVFLLCLAGFVFALATGSDSLPWPYIVVNYVFFIGLSQYGIAFVAILRISNAKWSRSFYRVGEVLTLSFFPIAIIGFLCIYFFGKEALFAYWLHPVEGEHVSGWLNAPFLFWRNLIAQLVFYTAAFAYVMVGLMPEVTEQNSQQGPKWRQSLYKMLLARKAGKDTQAMKRDVYLYSPVILLLCALANTFIAWDFGMMLTSHYHSTVFPMYVMMGNMFAGTALIFLLFLLLSQFSDLGRFFDTHVQGKSTGIMLTAFSLLWLYFFWAQFFVSWFGNLPYEYGVISKQMYGHYAPMFWIQMVCLIGAPIGALIFAKTKRTILPMVIIALVINSGVWINRYLIVMPAYYDDHRLLASFSEIIVSIGFLSGFLFMVLLFANAFPMASSWELEDAAKGADARSPKFGFD